MLPIKPLLQKRSVKLLERNHQAKLRRAAQEAERRIGLRRISISLAEAEAIAALLRRSRQPEAGEMAETLELQCLASRADAAQLAERKLTHKQGRKPKQILVIDDDTGAEWTFPSRKEAAEALGVTEGSLTAQMSKGRGTWRCQRQHHETGNPVTLLVMVR